MPGRIVLAGGGHAHLQVIESLGRRPLANWQIVLVSPDKKIAYSGMLSGLLAGHYRRDEIEIDLQALCQHNGIDFVQGYGSSIDRDRRLLLLEDGRELAFDLLSLDVGGASVPDRIADARDHAIPVRSIERLIGSVTRGSEGRWFTVIGGGAGGAETALALHHRTGRRTAQSVHHVRLVTAGTLLEGQPHGMRQKVRELFETRGIALMENVEIAKIGASEIVSADGEHYPSDATILATGPLPHGWLARTGLVLVDGSIAIGPMLQSISDPNIFATGDCATLVERPQLKSGVNAVRAGAILAQNLRLRAENQQLRMWRPPALQLMLLGTGDQCAFASWGAFWWAGKWVWLLKRRIDRRWVRRFTIFS